MVINVLIEGLSIRFRMEQRGSLLILNLLRLQLTHDSDLTTPPLFQHFWTVQSIFFDWPQRRWRSRCRSTAKLFSKAVNVVLSYNTKFVSTDLPPQTEQFWIQNIFNYDMCRERKLKFDTSVMFRLLNNCITIIGKKIKSNSNFIVTILLIT